MLKGIHIKTFLDCYREWHAFAIGFCEVFCPWPPRFKVPSEKTNQEIADEYHYYLFGRAVGVLSWLLIAKIIQEAFF
jgi:hypothetical protein